MAPRYITLTAAQRDAINATAAANGIDPSVFTLQEIKTVNGGLLFNKVTIDQLFAFSPAVAAAHQGTINAARTTQGGTRTAIVYSYYLSGSLSTPTWMNTPGGLRCHDQPHVMPADGRIVYAAHTQANNGSRVRYVIQRFNPVTFARPLVAQWDTTANRSNATIISHLAWTVEDGDQLNVQAANLAGTPINTHLSLTVQFDEVEFVRPTNPISGGILNNP